MQTESTESSTRATNAAREMVLDLAVIEELRDAVGQEVVTELVDTFVQDLPTQVSAIETAATPDALSRAAHRLKGGSMSLGLIELREVCRRLEEAGRRGQIKEAAADVAAVGGAVGRAISALAAVRE